MKTIVYRGGALIFRIPAHWKEEYSDFDGGMFYEDVKNSGTLRVKVITLEAPLGKTSVSANELLEPFLQRAGLSSERIRHIGNNSLLRFIDETAENGTDLRIFYWAFANPVGPRNARVVTFSYTVLDEADEDRLKNEIDMLDAEIIKTVFSPNLND